MSRQFSFFLTDKDVVDLSQALGRELDLLAGCYESSAPNLSWSKRLDPASLRCSSRTLVLISPEDSGQIILKRIKTRPAAFYVDSLRSPVVECTLCTHSEQMLRAGRFYYHEGYYGEDGTEVLKSESFRKWAEKLFRVVKQHLTRDPMLDGAYVGENARAWAGDPSHSLKLL